MASKDLGRGHEIEQATGHAPWALLQCPECPRMMASSYEQDFHYPWSLKLSCRICMNSWWVCRECEDQRVHMRTLSQTSRHNRKKHKEAQQELEQQPPEQAKEANQPMETIRESPVVKYFSREASTRFFQDQTLGRSVENLVHRAATKSTSPQGTLHPEEVTMFLIISRFIASMTRTQRDILAMVLCSTTRATKRQMEQQQTEGSSAPEFEHIAVPQTKQDLRSLFSEGKHAVFPNLPHPYVHVMDDHAYILPSECVAHSLAASTEPPITSMSSVNPLSLSQEADEISDPNTAEGVTTIFVSFWSDDCEPNYSKTNRGSIWVLTMTIESRRSGSPNISQVYPMATGSKKTDHTKVTEIILKDIEKVQYELGSNNFVVMFNGKTGTNEKVSVHLLSIEQDQPEKRGFNWLMMGGSGYHGRWGYSAYLPQLMETLPACDECVLDLEKNLGLPNWQPRDCDKCQSWFARPNQVIRTKPDPNYPEDELTNNGTIPVFELTYAKLKEAVRKVHDKIGTGEWQKNHGREYLVTYGLNLEAQKEILDNALNCRVLKQAMEENNQEVIDACNHVKQFQPEKYKLWKWPPIWDTNLSLQQSVEPCMHQLFLGLVKTVCFEIQDWAALRNKYSSMRRALEETTLGLQKLRLSWCKIEPYRGEKLGGWVSENFMALGRVAPWLYSSLHWLEDDAPYVEPERPVGQWRIEDCKDFLRPRRLPLAGKVKELRQRVVDNKAMPIPPPVGGPLDDVVKLILMHWAMNSHIMGMDKGTNEEILVMKQLIMLFLSAFSKFDNSTRPYTDRTKPLWLTKYNFTCILNLPHQVSRLGPVRNRWEGSLRGEGFLKTIKPMVHGQRKNWQKNLLLNVLRRKTLLQLERDETYEDIEDDDDDDDSTSAIPRQMFRVYQSLELMRDFLEGKPVSCVLEEQGEEKKLSVYCVYKRGIKKYTTIFTCLPDTGVYHFGLWYFEMTEEEQDGIGEDILELELRDLDISDYGILLPLAETGPPGTVDGGTPIKYSLITSKWRSLNKNGDRAVNPYKYLQKELD